MPELGAVGKVKITGTIVMEHREEKDGVVHQWTTQEPFNGTATIVEDELKDEDGNLRE